MSDLSFRFPNIIYNKDKPGDSIVNIVRALEKYMEQVYTAVNSKDAYRDRGDPASYDWTQADLTTDGAWHDLDLSSVVTSNAEVVAVLLAVEVSDNDADLHINFRQNGNSNSINVGTVVTRKASTTEHTDLIVGITSGVIEYKADSHSWNTINIAVKGWWRK